MDFSPARMLLCCALLSVLSLSTARAGDEGTRGENQVGPAAAAAQMDAYLQAQKVKFAIEMIDAKDAARSTTGPLAVRVYADLPEAQQDNLAASLTATAKKTRTEGSTVMFYTLERANGGVTFTPSSLPSGNGAVDFSRAGGPSVYKLKRTVKL